MSIYNGISGVLQVQLTRRQTGIVATLVIENQGRGVGGPAKWLRGVLM